MPRARQTGKRRKIGNGRWRPGGLLLGAVGVFSCLAGCSSLTSTAGGGDPLLGEQPRNQAPPRTSAAPVKTGALVPPIPSPHLSSSPAALAAGTLVGGRPLAIDDQQPTPPTAGTQLRRPEPIVQPLPRSPAPPGLLTAGSWVPAAQTAANDPWQAQLRARGVLWQRQEQVLEGVKFIALVPHRQQPNVTHTYEATARDYPSAVQAVLQQIDAQR